MLDFVLNISGMSKGLHEVNGKKVLVPIGPRLITPQEGKWDTIAAIIDGMFGSRQAEIFRWWLSLSLKSLYSGQWQSAQVLAFVGLPASCKSLLQSIITLLLGGRQARVMQSVSGATIFNGDWAEAAHLVIEDDFSDSSRNVREHIKEKIKGIAVNRSHRIHPKYGTAIEIAPYWRLTISCNMEGDSLAVLPHLDDSVKNKISLLETTKFDMPMPARTDAEKDRLWNQIKKEAPALIYDLLQYGEPPEHLRDPEERFGIKAYHSPAVLERIEDISPEVELLNAVNDAMSAGAFGIGFEVEGNNAPDSRLEIIVSASEVHEVLRHRGAPHYWNSKWIGRKLSTLASMRPKQVQIVTKSNSQGHRYRIVGNGGELL